MRLSVSKLIIAYEFIKGNGKKYLYNLIVGKIQCFILSKEVEIVTFQRTKEVGNKTQISWVSPHCEVGGVGGSPGQSGGGACTQGFRQAPGTLAAAVGGPTGGFTVYCSDVSVDEEV